MMEHDIELLEKTVANMKALRREFHRHPEMAYKEVQTAKQVSTLLESYGLTVTTNIASTGVVGVLDRGEGPRLGLRADMDALPIHEDNELAYCSNVPGVMHACGHDGHTTMLLGAAAMLAKTEGLQGKITFIFQPAEENEGGAKQMIEEGLFTKFDVDYIYALHNLPNIPAGTILAQPGPISAAFDTFEIEVLGKGGHGAIPELTQDPILAASALVQALNTIVSRKVSPLESAVVSMGKISSGETYNVIPNSAHLMGSCRSFNGDVQAILQQQISNICEGIGKAYDVSVKCNYKTIYPAVINDEKATQKFVNAIERHLPAVEMITEFSPFMGSEDFSYFLEVKPGCYFGIGNGVNSASLHTPDYDFNDNILETGISVWCSLAKEFLKKE
jgi:hippurate hydrolase